MRHMTTEPITSFDGKYRFLSNFLYCEVGLDGDLYPSVEHAFQAAKTKNSAMRYRIRMAKTPGQAKRMGRKCVLCEDWEETKILVMESLLRKKFRHPNLKRLLLATGDAELIEGNNWGDTFWGVCNDIGENNLGKLLMKIRSEFQNQ